MNTVLQKAKALFADRQALNDAEELYLACKVISDKILADDAYKDDYENSIKQLFSQVEFLRDDCIRGHWFWSHVRRDIKSRLAQQWTLMNELHETFLISQQSCIHGNPSPAVGGPIIRPSIADRVIDEDDGYPTALPQSTGLFKDRISVEMVFASYRESQDTFRSSNTCGPGTKAEGLSTERS